MVAGCHNGLWGCKRTAKGPENRNRSQGPQQGSIGRGATMGPKACNWTTMDPRDVIGPRDSNGSRDYNGSSGCNATTMSPGNHNGTAIGPHWSREPHLDLYRSQRPQRILGTTMGLRTEICPQLVLRTTMVPGNHNGSWEPQWVPGTAMVAGYHNGLWGCNRTAMGPENRNGSRGPQQGSTGWGGHNGSQSLQLDHNGS